MEQYDIEEGANMCFLKIRTKNVYILESGCLNGIAVDLGIIMMQINEGTMQYDFQIQKTDAFYGMKRIWKGLPNNRKLF